MPPEYMQGLLHTIESAVITVYQEFPKLADKDVESAYEKLGNYFKGIHAGKDLEEPTSNASRIQAIMDKILNMIDMREEMGADNGVVAEGSAPSLESFYARAFKVLGKSARNWRKRNGRTGYLSFISTHVA